ncbi:alpha/beta-hydrolase [Marasmius fiardii PR-910]|nr:alpha/beta-hydrolase [Marasmius fiardii PR-910]
MLIQLKDVRLEANISLAPPNDQSESKLAICLHPWSWLGGQMHDPVLESLITPLHSKNYHVIRYNSRGVGRSSGWPSLTGSKETEDLKSLVQWALENPEMPNIHSVVLIGYSYGSLIAATHPLLIPPIQTSHILISYPVSVRGWLTLFQTSTYARKLKDLLSNPSARVLVIFGDRDEFTSKASYSTWEAELRANSEQGQLQLECIDGASHFWGDSSARQLRDKIEMWLM